MPAPSAAVRDEEAPAPLADAPEREARLAAMAEANFQFIWRSLRRLGVPAPQVDDAAQQVFEVAARRLESLELGRERAFLFKTALLVATEARRVNAGRRARDGGAEVDRVSDAAPNPEEATELGEKRALLDRVLLALPLELRTAFVLFELEELAMSEIAELLGVPQGTVASRLRRAREEFHDQVKRLRARLAFGRSLP